MDSRLLVFLATIWVACLVPGRCPAEEDRLEQLERRVRQLEKRARPDAGTQHQPGDFVLPGFAVLALAAFCALWARSTGRDPWLWLTAGLVFNVFALLAVWAKHEGDKKVAQVAESGGPFERRRVGTASSQNVRPA